MPTVESCPFALISTLARSEACARLLQCLAAKQAVIAELIGGRLTLLEAAARFLRCSQEAEEEEDGEQTARAVIGWAHLALRDRPERADALGARLEQELQLHLARHGSVRLPST